MYEIGATNQKGRTLSVCERKCLLSNTVKTGNFLFY